MRIVWDAATGEKLLTLDGHTDDVRGVAFSSDGGRIVSGSKTTVIWGSRHDEHVLSLRGHVDLVTSVSFSRNGRRVVSEDVRGYRIVWDSRSGERLDEQIPTDELTHAAVSPDGLIRAIPDNHDVLLIHENPEVDLWVEDAARRRATKQTYHATAAKEAAADADWYAASFHFRRLVESTPNDPKLLTRLKIAEVKLENGEQAEIRSDRYTVCACDTNKLDCRIPR